MYKDHLKVRFTPQDFKKFFEDEQYKVTLETQSTYIYAKLEKNNVKQTINFGDYGLEVNGTGQVKRLNTLLKRVETKQYRDEQQNTRKINGKVLLANFKKAFELCGINFDNHTITHNYGTYGISGASASIFLNEVSDKFIKSDRIRCQISETSKMSYVLTINSFEDVDLVKDFIATFEENYIATSL